MQKESDLCPFQDLLNAQGGLIFLDGGLATALEDAGEDLSCGPLWSARLISDNPGAIEAAHYDYYNAGADVAIAATYQASFQGLIESNMAKDEIGAAEVMRQGVQIAVQARDKWWLQQSRHRLDNGGRKEEAGTSTLLHSNRNRPLVAASVGPYGAAQADGSEYHGQYNAKSSSASATVPGPPKPLTVEDLRSWHAPRLEILSKCPGVDVLAIETIPSLKECEALLQCLSDLVDTENKGAGGNRLQRVPSAWLTFSCCDGKHLSDGTALSTALEMLQRLDCGGSEGADTHSSSSTQDTSESMPGTLKTYTHACKSQKDGR